MIENLLDLSRLDAGQMGFSFTETLIEEAIDDVLHQARSLVGDRPIEILASARSTVDGKDYPMAFAFSHGEGRVFHSPLGHDVGAIANPAVARLFRRGCAWAAGLEPAPLRKKVVLIAEPFSPANGILTPTLKLKRRVAIERYGDQLEALYGDKV